MRCLIILFNISYKYNITNLEVRKGVTNEIRPHSELLAIVIEITLQWNVHVTRSSNSKQIIFIYFYLKIFVYNENN